MEIEVHREGEAAEFLTPHLLSLCQLSREQKLRPRLGNPGTAPWHSPADTALPAAERILTTMTRMTGPAKLHMRGSCTEIQQKSGFP